MTLLLAKLTLLASGSFILYTYLGYPLLVAAVAAIARRRPKPLNRWPPSVSIVIAVHNGEAHLPDKLTSLREQDYPAEQIEIIVVSDGSDDGTNQWLERQADVTWEALTQRSGKPTALNRGAELASGEILLFTDARQPLNNTAVSELVNALSDPKVGVAGGELVLDSDASQGARSVGLYWHYEKWIRSNESLVHSTAGVSGALYAVAKSDFEPLRADTLLDDFDVPAALLRQRKRVVLVPTAQAFDRAEADAGREKIRKIRTLTGNFQSFGRHRWLFNPLRNPVFIQFLSHKVFRLLVPYAMVAFFASSIVLRSWWSTGLALLQLGFYLSAWLAANLPTLREQNRLLSVVHTFVELNSAAVIAAVNYFTGRYKVTWEKTN